MFATKNSLPPETREFVVVLLNQMLASALDLYIRVKNAHWNVKGPNFIALHQLFDGIADYAAESADDLAERAAALGGVVDGTSEAAHLHTGLPPLVVPQPVAGLEFARSLSTNLATFVNANRRAIEDAIEFKDQATADLLIKITRDGDRQLWFLEAHTQ